jgi:hypothetical protein
MDLDPRSMEHSRTSLTGLPLEDRRESAMVPPQDSQPAARGSSNQADTFDSIGIEPIDRVKLNELRTSLHLLTSQTRTMRDGVLRLSTNERTIRDKVLTTLVPQTFAAMEPTETECREALAARTTGAFTLAATGATVYDRDRAVVSLQESVEPYLSKLRKYSS